MPQNISSREIHLLKREIEILGEALSRERLHRIAELDQMHLENKALRKVLEKLLPNFGESYDSAYDELRQSFNPESQAV